VNPKISICAQLSLAVYSEVIPDGFVCDSVQKIECQDTDTFGMACITANEVYFVFQGSESRSDWLNNFKIIRKEFHGIKAHKGFAEAAQSVLADVVSIIAANQGKDIVITGHSLGGAIAALIAVALRPQQVELITFGQPRVASSRQLRLALYGEYIRVVNGSDVVPRKPWLGYSHAGTCAYITNGGQILIDPSEFLMFRDRLVTLIQRGSDHTMSHYVAEIGRISANVKQKNSFH